MRQDVAARPVLVPKTATMTHAVLFVYFSMKLSALFFQPTKYLSGIEKGDGIVFQREKEPCTQSIRVQDYSLEIEQSNVN